MRELSQRVYALEDAPTGTQLEGDELQRALLDFLKWAEQSKGLALCQAFKPQYDWYMPTITSKENLVREYLGKTATGLGKPKKLAA
jgi:hypothetical protein